MNAPDERGPWGGHPVATIAPATSPLQESTLCDIGRAVSVGLAHELWSARGAPIAIPYDDDDLGWVDASSLRLFRVDEAHGALELVDDSWVDQGARVVHGYVHRSGVYVVIGLPGPGPVREVIEELAELVVSREPASEWQARIADSLTAARHDGNLASLPAGLRRAQRFPLSMPPTLAEIELLKRPVSGPKPFPVDWGGPDVAIPFTRRPRPKHVHLLGYVTTPAGYDMVLETVDPVRWKLLSRTALGTFSYNEWTSVKAVRNRVAILINSNRLRLIDGPSIRDIPLGADSICMSPDGETVYTASPYDGIEAIDFDYPNARTPLVSPSSRKYRNICISDDGSIIAAAYYDGSPPAPGQTAPAIEGVVAVDLSKSPPKANYSSYCSAAHLVFTDARRLLYVWSGHGRFPGPNVHDIEFEPTMKVQSHRFPLAQIIAAATVIPGPRMFMCEGGFGATPLLELTWDPLPRKLHMRAQLNSTWASVLGTIPSGSSTSVVINWEGWPQTGSNPRGLRIYDTATDQLGPVVYQPMAGTDDYHCVSMAFVDTAI